MVRKYPCSGPEPWLLFSSLRHLLESYWPVPVSWCSQSIKSQGLGLSAHKCGGEMSALGTPNMSVMDSLTSELDASPL